MQAAELGRRLDPDLVDQGLPGVAERLERVGLAPAPVQREHPLRVQPLPQRVLRQQRVDIADDLVMAAGGQARLDRQLPGREPQLVEPADLGARERLVGEVRERLAAKQRERLSRRPVGRSRLGCACRLGHEPFQATGVHELAIDPQLVRAPARHDLRAAVAGQQLLQPPDVVLDHLRRARRRLLSPQPLDQPVGRDRPVGLEPEHRQDGALLRPAERDRAVVDAGLEMSKDAEPHA